MKQRVFKGMVPKVHPRNLAEGYAAMAVNANLSRGVLEAFRTDAMVRSDALPDTQAWMHPDGCRVNLPCDASIAEDQVGCGAVFATGVAPYPVRATPAQWAAGFSTRLGLPPPPAAPDVAWAPFTLTADGATPRAFTYAYVNEFDEPSLPSPPSFVTTVNWDTGAVVGGFQPAPAEYRVTHYVVYILQPGVANLVGTPAAEEARWFEIARIPVAQTSYTYSSGVPLGQTLLDFDNNPPPADLRDIQCWGADVLAGLSQDELLFSRPGVFGAWPDKYRMRMHAKPLRFLAGQTYGYVLTCGQPEVVRLAHDGSKGGVREHTTINEELPLVGLRAAAVYDGACFYASRQGVVMLSGARARLITEDLWTQEQWEALHPHSMVFTVYQGYLIATGTGGAFRLKVPTDIHAPPQPGDLVQLALSAASFFHRQGELYYVGAQGGLYHWQRGASRRPYTYVTRIAAMPNNDTPKVFKVTADGPDVQVTVSTEGMQHYSGPAHVGRIVPLPRGFRGGTIQVTLTGRSTVTEVALATSAMDLAR